MQHISKVMPKVTAQISEAYIKEQVKVNLYAFAMHYANSKGPMSI